MIKDIGDWVKKLSESKALIVVEGKKDLAALSNAGISAISLHRRPLYLVAEEIASASKDCVILTDLDREGKRLYAILKMHLSSLGVRIDTEFREWLFRETKLRQIEGLANYMKKEEKKS